MNNACAHNPTKKDKQLFQSTIEKTSRQRFLVIPEVPLGTLATISACFLALIISQMKHRTKLQ